MKKHDSSTQKTTSKRLTPISVALLYAAFAALWIIAFGKLLVFTADDAVLQGRIELAEGLIFVAVTSGLLYLLLKGWHGTEESVTTVQDDGIRSLATGRLILLFVALMLVVPLIGVTITILYS